MAKNQPLSRDEPRDGPIADRMRARHADFVVVDSDGYGYAFFELVEELHSVLRLPVLDDQFELEHRTAVTLIPSIRELGEMYLAARKVCPFGRAAQEKIDEALTQIAEAELGGRKQSQLAQMLASGLVERMSQAEVAAENGVDEPSLSRAKPRLAVLVLDVLIGDQNLGGRRTSPARNSGGGIDK